MERILIIGSGGAGKSTLARALGEKLGLPVVHLDKLWWTGNWENVPLEEFDARLTAALAMPRWIIDGNYSRTMPERIAQCDTIIYLDFNRFVCLWGMIRRVICNYGKIRPDMGGECRERFDREFIRWIWNYNRNNRARNYAWLNEAVHARTFVLKNRREVRRFLSRI